MRTISLRRFNAEVADLREAVEIVRRSPDGALITLGNYYPKGVFGNADDDFEYDVSVTPRRLTRVGPQPWNRRQTTESET